MSKVDEMVAGRELDALVAQKVMGWTQNPHRVFTSDPIYANPNGRPDYFPPYSTDMTAAWEVVERMVSRGEVFIVKGDGQRSGDNPRWTILVGNQPRTDDDSAPLAICRAALKAVSA